MLKEILASEEKKVEYLELIYDLIFVYVIGRNNQVLHYIENGFVTGTTFLTYILCTLAVIQIWNYSTFYINMFGRNGLRDHISLFLNMYLLYYIGVSTSVHWETSQNRYHTAWALILINIGVQYLIELKNHRGNPENERTIRRMMIVLFGEAAIVLLAIPVYNRMGIPLAGAAILFGIVMTWAFADDAKAEIVDFNHLTERVMLYVVFTFGEMIITIAEYFNEDLTWNSVYFSFLCFLIVTGLFLSYEILYDRIIDRNRNSTGMYYMMIHIFLIFSMNCITTSLRFMRREGVALMPKMIFLLLSFLLYFLCLFLLQLYAKPELCLRRNFMLPVIGVSGAFVIVMLLLRENMWMNILISAVYVYLVFRMIYRFSRTYGCGCERASEQV